MKEIKPMTKNAVSPQPMKAEADAFESQTFANLIKLQDMK